MTQSAGQCRYNNFPIFKNSLADLSQKTVWETNNNAWILLSLSAANNVLPQTIENFPETNDLSAHTIYPFVLGETSDRDAIVSAISDRQPGALLGESALLITQKTNKEEITTWAENLGVASRNGILYLPKIGLTP